MLRIKIQICASVHHCLQALQPTNSSNPSHPGSTGPNPAPLARFRCPYCTVWLTSASGRTRHILYNLACAAAGTRGVAHARATREEVHCLGIALLLMTRVMLDDVLNALDLHAEDWVPPVGPPVGDVMMAAVDTTMTAGDATTAATGATTADRANPDDTPMSDPPMPPHIPLQVPASINSTRQGLDKGGGEGNGDGNGRGGKGKWDHSECGKPFVKPFSDPRMGQPINNSHAEPFNLCVHMASVGRFASPADFEVAELLMTMKMTNAAQDAHLKSQKISHMFPLYFLQRDKHADYLLCVVQGANAMA
ncbi:hypothetical protein FRC07_002116 [Ceratobasidium sp. 392]|nr:hypothetical protein FRC07_002116 [Ceratobasidium sp. 392]